MNIADLLNTALNYHREGDLASAEIIYKDLLNEYPDNINIIYFYGLLLFQTGNSDKSLDLLLTISPDYSGELLYKDVLLLLGKIHHFLNQTQKAIYYYNIVLQIDPSLVECHKYLLDIYSKQNDIDNIIGCYRNLISLEPNQADYYFDLALWYEKKSDYNAAFNLYHKAIEINPNHSMAYTNLGFLYYHISKHKEAYECLSTAYRINPKILECIVTLSEVCLALNKPDNAIEVCMEGLKHFPDNELIYTNLLKARLVNKDIEKGWDYFKYRRIINENKQLSPCLLDYHGPLEFKKVLIYSDSGIGDTINFVRYVPLLADKGAHVTCCIQEPLISLFKNSNLNAEILSDSEVYNVKYDYSISITSLSYLFKPDSLSFHLSDKYLFADKEKVKQYKEKYFDNDNFKLGIVWQSGSPEGFGSIAHISSFFEFTKIPNIKTYSIQKGSGSKQLDNIPKDIEIVNLGKTFNDFSDTAAALQCLDLLITCDTSVAHLAGAMGINTRMVLSCMPNWRWFSKGEKCSWYDSIKIFRQNKEGEWDGVIEELYRELLRLF